MYEGCIREGLILEGRVLINSGRGLLRAFEMELSKRNTRSGTF